MSAAPSRVVLSTRPEQASAETARALAAAGFAPIDAPMTRIVRRDRLRAEDLRGVGRLVFTSAAAARVAAQDAPPSAFAQLSAVCVGDATAAAARAAGVPDVISVDGDAAALAEAFQSFDPGGGALLHLRGAATTGDLAGAARACGLAWREVTLYEAVLATTMPSPAAEALQRGEVWAVLFFSARAAEAFDAVNEADLTNVVAVCISRRVGEAVEKNGFAQVLTAARPRLDAIIEALSASWRSNAANRATNS